MKRIKRFLLAVTLAVAVLVQSTQSYAWVSAEGNSGNISSFISAYAIDANLQGWLVYWIDDSQSVISDVCLLDSTPVDNTFATANYKVIKTRYQDRNATYSDELAVWGLPLPYNDPNTNAPQVREWIGSHRDFLVDNLNAPQDIKTCKDEDKYFFIAEPVYMFSLYSSVQGVPKKTIVGTTYQYARYIENNLLGSAEYPRGVPLFDADRSKCGLTDYGWWGTCLYTNGLYGTFECTGVNQADRVKKIGIMTQGESFFNYDFANQPLSFNVLGDKSVGLGIVVMSNSEKLDGEITPNPDLVTHPYVGTAKPDTWTYNYATEFNLNKYNDPQGRIPSGEMITNGIDVDKWYCDYSLTKHSPSTTGESRLKKKVSVTYNIKWTVINSYTTTEDDLSEESADSLMSRSDVHSPSKSKTHSKDPNIVGDEDKYSVTYYGESQRQQQYKTYVTRESYYYTIDTYNVYTFNKAVVTCENTNGVSSITGEKVIYNGNFDVSYTKLDTGKIIHTPTNVSGVSVYADNYEDGKRKAEARKLSDADDFVVQNDYLEVGGKVFIPNTRGQHGADFVKLATYNFPDTGTGSYETAVTIPFTCPNDYYYTSATYTYKSALDPTKGVTIQKNAWETHSANRATIDERIHQNYRQNEPVFVHTPVVNTVDTSGSGEVQLVAGKVNDTMVDYQLRLDNTYEFQFDIEKHLNLLGYSLNGYEWDYAKYVKKAQVLFPFDVAIVTNPSGANVYTYYKAKTWIDIDYLIPTTYYIPSWAVETDYDEIYFRTIAYNIDEALSEDEYHALEQETHNLIPSNYVAYSKIAIQLSGYLYDLQVVGSNDGIKLNFTDTLEPVEFANIKKEFRAGTRNRLGGDQIRFTKDSLLTASWNEKFTLPFSNGSNLQSNIAGTLGKGTELAFTVKTIANLWNKNDELVIVPRLRYVSPSGTQYNYDDTKIYYFAGTGNEFVEVGTDRDLGVDICSTMLPPTKLTFPQFNGSYNRDEIARTLPLFNRINETGYDESYVITNSGKQSFVGEYSFV